MWGVTLSVAGLTSMIASGHMLVTMARRGTGQSRKMCSHGCTPAEHDAHLSPNARMSPSETTSSLSTSCRAWRVSAVCHASRAMSFSKRAWLPSVCAMYALQGVFSAGVSLFLYVRQFSQKDRAPCAWGELLRRVWYYSSGNVVFCRSRSACRRMASSRTPKLCDRLEPSSFKCGPMARDPASLA